MCAWYPAAAGSDEGPGANFTPATLGNFVKPNTTERLLREARAESAVITEARGFHERQARKYGVDTNRGIAHFRASKMYAREGKLQEMFDQMQQQPDASGGELGQLNPKAVMKAHMAAAKFHKKSADKAGLDSDLGHAHVAAMENHMDVAKKAKQAHQEQSGKQPPQQKGQKQQMPPQQQQVPPAGKMPNVAAESEEGGKGSGRHKGSGTNLHAQHTNLVRRLANLLTTDEGTIRKEWGSSLMKELKKGTSPKEIYNGVKEDTQDSRESHREAFGGHGSKQSPVPVPKKKDMQNEDVHDPNKPSVALKPEDANKPGSGPQQGMSRLLSQQAAGEHAGMRASAEGGPGSGRHAGGGGGEKTPTMKGLLKQAGFKHAGTDQSGHTFDHPDGRSVTVFHGGSGWDSNDATAGGDNAHDLKDFLGGGSKSHESRRHAISRFGREAGENCVSSAVPSPVKKQMQPETVYRGKRLKMRSGTVARTKGDEHFTNHHESRFARRSL